MLPDVDVKGVSAKQSFITVAIGYSLVPGVGTRLGWVQKMSRESIEFKALLQCSSGLTDLLQHNISVSARLLEKGLVTKDIHDWILTSQGTSNQDKAARLVSCVTDRVKNSAQVFHEFVDMLNDEPFFVDVVDKLTSLHSTLFNGQFSSAYTK